MIQVDDDDDDDDDDDGNDYDDDTVEKNASFMISIIYKRITQIIKVVGDVIWKGYVQK